MSWTKNSSGYRYGFNSQEQDDEVYGAGNSLTAEFWQYDTRLGRRWNLDPRPVGGMSPYLAFQNNPIKFSDVKGDSVYTDQEGADILNEGIEATLGEENPFIYDAEKGIFTIDENFDKSNYTEDQMELYNRLSAVVSDPRVVNFKIVSFEQEYYYNWNRGDLINPYNPFSSLKKLSATGTNDIIIPELSKRKDINAMDLSKITAINVYVSRNHPFAESGSEEFVPALIALHEVSGHSYYVLAQPSLSLVDQATLTTAWENRIREFYMLDKSFLWFDYKSPIGGSATPHGKSTK